MANRWRRGVVGFTMMLGLAGRAGAASPPSVAVVAFDQAGIDAGVLARAKTEIARIYGEAGVSVRWIEPAALESSEAFTIQLLLRRRPVNGSTSIMGTAIGDVHEARGSAFVFYDRVLVSAHQEHQDVARVLAYAMAHEMGHLLLPPAAHSPSGIMRADRDGNDLRRIGNGSLQFTDAQASAMRVKASGCCATSPSNEAGAER